VRIRHVARAAAIAFTLSAFLGIPGCLMHHPGPALVIGGADFEIVFVRGGRLYAVQPDGFHERLIAPRLTGCREPQGSPHGEFIAVASGGFVYLVRWDGARFWAIADNANTEGPAFPNWSPDGRAVCFTGSDNAIHVVDLDAYGRGAGERSYGVSDPGLPAMPSFFPTAGKLAFVHQADGENFPQIYSVAADGTSVTRLWSTELSSSPAELNEGTSRRPVVSPDGKSILFENDARGGFDLWTIGADGLSPVCVTGSDVALEAGDESDAEWERNTTGRFMPDGRIVFASRRATGKADDAAPQIWIADADGGDPKALTSSKLAASEPGILVRRAP